MKAIAAYEIGANLLLTEERAATAIAEARRFIAAIVALMPTA